jgi:ABC-2 type transport system ATP-binding protein
MANTVIRTGNLSKQYASTRSYSLKDLSLDIVSGEVYGLLGANGAGKSTTIRCLLNFIQPSSGSATILGQDIVKDSVSIKRSVGYLSGEIALFPKMTGEQFLHYMSDLQPMTDNHYLKELTALLQADLKKPLGTLSKGNKQKIGLLQAFMHEPAVLILDEPTSGLDPLMQEIFYDMIKAARDRGACVFISSHNLTEVRRMCDRIGFLRDGKLIVEQTIADLAANAAHTFDITFLDSAPIVELRHIKHAKLTAQGKHRVSVQLNGDLAPLFTVLARHHVATFEQQELNLEDEFLALYRKEQA